MKHLLPLLCLFLLAGCEQRRDLRREAMRTETGAAYHWMEATLPAPIYIDPVMSDGFAEVLKSSAEIWNIVIGHQVFEVAGFHDVFMDVPTIGAIEVIPGNFAGTPYAGLGMPAVYRETGSILFCQVIVDYSMRDAMEVVLVLLHELGHCLGLAHDFTNPGSLMHPSPSFDAHIEVNDIDYILEYSFHEG